MQTQRVCKATSDMIIICYMLHVALSVSGLLLMLMLTLI